MYKKWDVKDIKNVIEEVSIKMEKDATNIPIRISNKMVRTKGMYKFSKGMTGIKPLEFAFAECLINGSYEEKIVREVIIHEYIHFYTMDMLKRKVGHNDVFKANCRKAGISDSTYFENEREEEVSMRTKKYKYEIKCTKCDSLGYKQRINIPMDAYENRYCCKFCGSNIKVTAL